MTRSGARDALLLDTSAYSRLRSGDPRVIDAVAEATAVLVPTIVLGELEAGFRLGSRERDNLQALREFLAEPFVAIQGVSAEVASFYAEIFADLRRAGTPIPTNDLWIAACAMAAPARLLTFDAHFERVARLRLARLA